VGFVVDKVALGQVFFSTSVSPANSHSTDCSTIIIIYHLGLVQQAKQYQVDPVSPHERKKPNDVSFFVHYNRASRDQDRERPDLEA
jgi:hypothetical protein